MSTRIVRMGPDIPEGCPDGPGGGPDYPFGMMASDKLGLATTTDLNREKHHVFLIKTMKIVHNVTYGWAGARTAMRPRRRGPKAQRTT